MAYGSSVGFSAGTANSRHYSLHYSGLSWYK